jgi:hypothetical protein
MRFVLVFAGLIVVCRSASGQTIPLRDDARMRGITEVALVTGPLNQEASQKCGLSAEAVRLEASKSILDAKLKLGDLGSPYVLFLTITTIREGTLCVSYIDASIQTLVTTVATQTTPAMRGLLELGTSGELMSSGSSRHGPDVRDMIRNHVTDLMTRIRIANQ